DQGQIGVDLVKKQLALGQHYTIIFVDIRMPPGWDGIKTITKIWEIDPEAQIVICTAYSDYSWEEILNKFGPTDQLLILKKPFDNIEVRQLVISLTKKWLLGKQVSEQLNLLHEMVDKRTAELTKSFSLLRATFESTGDGILVTDNNDEIVDYNNKFVKLWNIPRSMLESKKFDTALTFILDKLTYPEIFLKKVKEFYKLSGQESFNILELKNNKIFECYSHPQLLKQEIIGRVWDFRDITENKRMEEQLAYQALHDVLTGLANRTLLLENTEKNIQNAIKEERVAAILFFDLDRFKLINDTLGHSIGDKLLKAVALRMKKCVRPEDTLARLGGDEFVLLTSSLHDENDVINIMKRFLSAITKPFNINGNIFNITASAGISLYPKDGETAEMLFKNSDIAMYRAKEMGGNNFQFFTPSMNIHTTERLMLSNDLAFALENNEFLLHYQPLVDVKTKKIVGIEALIRWQHPKRGLLMPIEFIPIAEETGLIIPIGEWTLHTACKQVKAWQNEGFGPLWLSVNLSSVQVMRGDIVKTVTDVLQKTQFDPELLCLEIAESLVIENTQHVKNTLINLKKLHILLAIDDFGIGYSGLSYLNQFPIDKLKIGPSFVRDVTGDANDAALVLAIIGMAKSLQMKVLAEGVETHEQLTFLRNNNCDEMQGYIISKPVDAMTCRQLLASDTQENPK
ncbi:MAG: EAL domain-containing protein, partial [Gammaproteobacteria bacterium]